MTKWNLYPATRPEETGLYLVTRDTGDTRFTGIYKYNKTNDRWTDHFGMRLAVYNDQFEVYEKVEGPDGSEALSRVMLNHDTFIIKDVIAWARRPKPYCEADEFDDRFKIINNDLYIDGEFIGRLIPAEEVYNDQI